jgi:hypothetical protein
LGEISILNLKIKDNKITNHLKVSKELKRYIKTPEMFVEYDDQIYADESILNIPLIATILPLAWLTSSNIKVEKLDKTFKKSMDQLQNYFKEVYPLIPFNTKFHVKQLLENKIETNNSESRTGLLFSGGIDSVYSLFSNLQLKPKLIMHWGVERTPYPIYSEYWEMVNSIYKAFADKHSIQFHLTKTNALEILHRRKIEHRYYKELLYGTFWERLQISLVLLGLAAPLSVKRFNKLLIAASAWPTSIETLATHRPYATRPESDEKIAWADLKVKHDGYIEKYKKVRALAEYTKNDPVLLRVCLNRKDAPRTLNCSQCEKCCRTITQLIQAKMDPNLYGFKVTDNTQFKKFKKIIQKSGLNSIALNSHNIIPEKIDFDLYGSKEYFEWLRGFNVPEKNHELFFRDIYNMLPFPLAKAMNEIYRIFRINIHFGNPNLPMKTIKKLEPVKNNNPRARK